MSKTSSTRIFRILARSAPVAVLLRRGPSRQVLLIKWNLGSDTLEYGQWFKGRIYERRCDLSPSGDLLLNFAAKYKEPLRSWSAISKPPFLTALAMWAKGDGWGGGGLFDTELSIQLNHRPGEEVLAEGFRLKKSMRIALYGARPGWGEDFPIYHQPELERNGLLGAVPTDQSNSRYYSQSCISPTGSCKLSPYCESTFEERSAVNLHAPFCGSRRWVTTSGHPVGTGQLVSLPRSPVTPFRSVVGSISPKTSALFGVTPFEKGIAASTGSRT
jgi:hypothetical protein